MMNSIEIFEHINHKIRNILKKGLNGEQINNKEALELLKTTGKEFLALQSVANEICFEKKKDLVTFVVNRNINFTNVCYQKCKFCSFSVPQNHSEAFLLTNNEIEKKILESNKFDITEVCIQGGINPELTFDYYLDILRKVKEINSEIHIHAFSPQEVYYMAK
ncbi:MAG: 7,8-didemethyl-8-hydroxy-5-deazariboflavin synthase subunit CofH, partial [Candidatus Lokiarchaeota archaeon]|nr:7,8-didemethyl-8-hydroxy-5-deazariboflavin synthase subunit CofH [Candidatus Lokiarchaeota archaeon]MBD3198735.1 7,8-didemethyl-8-hydroxy-5-deazariboflavin synthase subunit CofH [Candidatus Lokiarchaeota archaeon]